MPPALVIGNANVETALRLDAFPLPPGSSYQPGRMTLGVSGVGWNVTRALSALGQAVRLGSVVGRDVGGELVRAELARANLSDAFLHEEKRTALSLVLSDASGARQVHADLGEVARAVYPPELFEAALKDCGLAVLTNVGYTRPLLARALAAGVPIATDLHAIRHLDNPYDQDYLAAATLLFLSGEHLSDPGATVARVRTRFDPAVIVVGLGERGALLSERGQDSAHVPAFPAARVVSSVGAGDALLAAFCHFWLAGEAPLHALRLATVFAAHKIGGAGGAQGFPTEAEVRARLNVW